ncbi:hypothetical protein PF003_g4819 [Phytophthora fragariae]|nr:hypothetical protein PF003_g4819 [Phytophthora fragariae]
MTLVLLARDLSLYDSDMLLESLKDYVVSKSGLSPCSLCTEPTPHNMRTRLLTCKCKACKTVAPYAHCPWKGKAQTCILSNVAFHTPLGFAATNNPVEQFKRDYALRSRLKMGRPATALRANGSSSEPPVRYEDLTSP